MKQLFQKLHTWLDIDRFSVVVLWRLSIGTFFDVVMSAAKSFNIITIIMIHIISSILVYSLLVGVHHSFLKGLRNKVYAVAHFMSAGITFFLLYSGMVR